MSSNPKIEISGTSPFKLPSGVFEVQISISDKKPSEDSIAKKNFPTLWTDNFHLKVTDRKFTEVLGSDKNPIPKSVFDLDSAWIVVADQFSPIHSVFEIPLKKQVTAPPKPVSKPVSRESVMLSRPGGR